MDVTTSKALERLTMRIDAFERSLRSEFREGLAGTERSLRDEFRERLGESERTLRDRFHEGLTENRRHSEVLSESLRDDIRMIAEGVVALDAKFDRRLPP